MRARVIEHGFDFREGATPGNMSQPGWVERTLGVELYPWQRRLLGVWLGGQDAPGSRAETWTRHIPGYMGPNRVPMAIPQSSIGPGLAGVS